MSKCTEWIGLAIRGALALLLLAGCGPLPQDPDDTLHQVRERGTLRTGVTWRPPWVTGAPPHPPDGAEVRLVEEFAAVLGVEPEWYWGSEQEVFAALEVRSLDIAIGGFTKSNPWRDRAGFSLPYDVTTTEVGVVAGDTPAGEVDTRTRPATPGDSRLHAEHHVIAITPGANALLMELERFLLRRDAPAALDATLSPRVPGR